jgi:hypothetical protein
MRIPSHTFDCGIEGDAFSQGLSRVDMAVNIVLQVAHYIARRKEAIAHVFGPWSLDRGVGKSGHVQRCLGPECIVIAF